MKIRVNFVRYSLVVLATLAFGSPLLAQQRVFTAADYDRGARFLAVMGWADTPLAQAADLVLPAATHAERDGTFVNVAGRIQRFERAFPAPGQSRAQIEILSDLLSRFDPRWASVTAPVVFDLMAEEKAPLEGLRWAGIPADGAALAAAEVGA